MESMIEIEQLGLENKECDHLLVTYKSKIMKNLATPHGSTSAIVVTFVSTPLRENPQALWLHISSIEDVGVGL
jgi:hypothetical protein